jgi:RsiW-degrading membrane proteinase PrsW (M82 family)
VAFFVTIALCALLTAGLVYRYDLYEHEPIRLLGVAVALGAGAMWVSGAIEDMALGAWRGAGPLGTALVASGTEELFKLIVVVVVAVSARREFDDPMDGLVYGSMAGLGAALEESLFYHRLAPTGHFAVPASELVRIWAHVVLGGIVGFPLGFWRARPRLAAGAAVAGLCIAVGFHLGWDALVLSVPLGMTPDTPRILAGMALMLGCLGLYGRLTVMASKRSREAFDPQSRLQLWGWPFRRRLPRTEPAGARRAPSSDLVRDRDRQGGREPTL